MTSLEGMDLEDRVREISTRISKRLGNVETEEATKTALVLPFIQNVLGYNVFEPTEVIPEFAADVGAKKGEKVDYAIMKDGKPIILIECKAYGVDLEKEPPAQLARYFHTTDARLGVVTDGATYRFYSDLEKSNVMDGRPFLEVDMLNPDVIPVDELRKFAKATFDLDEVLATAQDLKYLREVKTLLANEWTNPSEGFVRYLMSQVYSGTKTKQRLEQFQRLFKRASHEFIADSVRGRLESALQDVPAQEQVRGPAEGEVEAGPMDEIVTTADEWQGLYAVKASLRGRIDTHRIGMQDRKSYCAIVLDDSMWKPICRLHFNRLQKYVGLFDSDGKEERVPIDDVDDLFQYADRIGEAIERYEPRES